MIGTIAMTSIAIQLAASQGSVRFENIFPRANRLFSTAKLLDGYKSSHKKIPVFLGASVFFLLVALLPSYAIQADLAGLRRVIPSAQVAMYGGAFLEAFRYATGVFVIVGLVDFGWKFKSMQDELKMTKQEVKDESKDANGNPMVKSALRRRMKALLTNRMMQKIPEATVVVVNPTHFAVALQYDPQSSDAPMVTAKGLDFLALRMRRKAEELGVPVVENPPLAQALFKSADVGQKIPVELYRAVAEVLAYVFRVLGRRTPVAS
jgi:flagellar biosynthetic protein FlhB